MRPYAGRQLPLPKPVRIFNKRQSRAKLVVECTFGILAARWRMYRRVLGLSPANVDACMKANCSPQLPAEGIPGAAPDGDGHAKWAGANNAPRQALQVREKLTSGEQEL
ncbi:unnamed protein product [Coregonus sp. 'balchen']|nr:unnamed protein product [Coregonus sp. 'balchen']